MFLFTPFRLARRLVSLVVLAAVIYVVASGVQVVKASNLSTDVSALKPAGAIVVLGAPLDGNRPGTDFSDRLEQALVAYDARLAPTVLLTGTGRQTDIAGRWLHTRGVPTAAIVPIAATNAASGLSGAAASLGDRHDVIVVTDAIDALWTRGAATGAGLRAQIFPAANSEHDVFSEVDPLWRQATGVAVGRVIGYGRASWAST